MNGDENKILDMLRRFWGLTPNKGDRTGCPDEETLGQFLTGNLADDSRDRIEGHLALCSYCAQELVTAYKATETSDITRVPQRLMERAMALVPVREVFFDLAVHMM